MKKRFSVSYEIYCGKSLYLQVSIKIEIGFLKYAF